MGKPEGPGRREPARSLALDGRPSRRDDRLLEPAGRVEVVARPYQPDCGRGGAVAAVEVEPDCLDQAAIGGLIVRQRIAWLLPADQAARQVVVPGPQPRQPLKYLATGRRPCWAPRCWIHSPGARHR